MNIRTGILAALVAAFSIDATANTPGDYGYSFPIETSGSSSAWQIELTPAIYAASQDSAQRDIEAFNGTGLSIPLGPLPLIDGASRERREKLPLFALPADVDTTKTTSSDLHLSVERDADGRLRRIETREQSPRGASAMPPRVWLLDASAFDAPIDALELDWRTPKAGVDARFAVDASDDLQSWRIVVANAVVVALEQNGVRIDRRRVPLGDTRAKYLRVRRLDNGEPLADLGVTAHATERGRATRQWLATENTGTEPAEPGSARYVYRAPAGIRADSLRITLADDNALARVTVSSRAKPGDQPGAWTTRARFVAYRLLQDGARLDNEDVVADAANPSVEWRIDSTPALAHAPTLALGYRPDRLLFLAEGDGPYSLAVGSGHAHRPDAPIATAIATLRKTLGPNWQPPLASLGAAQPAGGANALLSGRAPFAWRTWLLWSVLVIGALTVAGFALSLLRSAKS